MIWVLLAFGYAFSVAVVAGYLKSHYPAIAFISVVWPVSLPVWWLFKHAIIPVFKFGYSLGQKDPKPEPDADAMREVEETLEDDK